MNPAFGKFLIAIGVLLVVLGFLFTTNLHLPIGRLPGDIHIKRDNFQFYFPLTTSILLSLLLSFILWLMRK